MSNIPNTRGGGRRDPSPQPNLNRTNEVLEVNSSSESSDGGMTTKSQMSPNPENQNQEEERLKEGVASPASGLKPSSIDEIKERKYADEQQRYKDDKVLKQRRYDDAQKKYNEEKALEQRRYDDAQNKYQEEKDERAAAQHIDLKFLGSPK